MLNTPIYKLEAFTRGDVFLSAVDRRRFLTIDNQLAFISEKIGNGIISGWNIYVKDNLRIGIESGFGFIENFATYTYGEKEYTLSNNRDVYVYMRRQSGVSGGQGGWSNIANVSYHDETPPSAPSGLYINFLDYDRVEIHWDKNNEVDFSHYKVFRSKNNIDYELLNEKVKDEYYLDLSVEQDTNYYYKISAVDFSNNESIYSDSIITKTLKDLRTPLPPSNFRSFSSNGSVRLMWQPSPTSLVEQYKVSYIKLDNMRRPIGTTEYLLIDSSKTNLLVSSLENNNEYKFSIVSVSKNGIESDVVDSISAPVSTGGPDEISGLDIGYEPDGANGIVVKLDWSSYVDPDSGNNYRITFYEDGGRVSEPISVVGSTQRNIRLLLFSSDGQLSNETVRELFSYYIRIQAIDTDGNLNNGNVFDAFTPTFNSPPPVSKLNISESVDGGLFVTWENPSYAWFSHNKITIEKQDNINFSSEIILNSYNSGRSTNYYISKDDVSPGHTFLFNIKTFDNFGNESDFIQATFSTVGIISSRPSSPKGQSIGYDINSIILRWERMNPIEIKSYRIYRSEYQSFPDASRFELIDEVDVDVTEYTDYLAGFSGRFMYIVTSVNRMSQESLNPIDDGYISGVLNASPGKDNRFGYVDSLSVSQNGHDAVLSWELSAGSFTGYEIWRSFGNKYSFEKIGSALAGDDSYIDKNSLLRSDGDYYYLIRRYRDEADIFVTESSATPSGSIFLGKISVRDGNIEIDSSEARIVKSLESLLKEESRIQIDSHRHTYDGPGRDKRIDLQSDVTVTQWFTNDYRNYITSENIGGASAYVVTVTGEINEEYFKKDDGGVRIAEMEQVRLGSPPFLYEINEELGIITFEQPLYGNVITYSPPSPAVLDFVNNPNIGTIDQQSDRLRRAMDALRAGSAPVRHIQDVPRPFISEPVVSVKLIGIDEVSGVLPETRIQKISASQVNSGQIHKSQMPKIHHAGRLYEKMIPLQSDMFTNDGFTFLFSSPERFSSSLTFYDIIKVPITDDDGNPIDDCLLAATSRGILVSYDFGSFWDEKPIGVFGTAPLKLFYSEKMNRCFALTNKGVFVSRGKYTSWQRMTGLENTKVLRDIEEDDDGNLYVTSDLGVYKLSIDEMDYFFSWTQTSLFGARSTESYSIINDNGDILVSNELGVLKSDNNAQSWSFSDSFKEQKIIYSFKKYGGKIFALTDYGIWRKDGEDFVQISSFSFGKSRKIDFFLDRMFVLTDRGVMATRFGDDLLNSDDIYLYPSFPEINLNGNVVPATSINIIDGVMFLGTDQRLFIRDENGDTFIHYERTSGEPPTIYVDGKICNVGLRYNSGTVHSVSFDDNIPVGSFVSAALGYSRYRAESGGWGMQKYDSDIILYLNGVKIEEFSPSSTSLGDEDEGSDNKSVLESFSSFVFPDFDDTNSHQVLAERLRIQAGEKLEEAVSSGGDYRSVGIALSSVERFLAALYPTARFLENGEPVNLPSIIFENHGKFRYDATTGVFEFPSSFSKYDSVNVDILGSTIENISMKNTHKDLENILETYNSGLPSSLSASVQSNLVKLGTYTERMWPGEQELLSKGHQFKALPVINSNFYNKLDSTIDYKFEVGYSKFNQSLTHASSAIDIGDGSVLVSGGKRIIKIDINNLLIKSSSVPENIGNINNLFRSKDGKIYASGFGFIMTSDDNGEHWGQESISGLPNDILCISEINNTLVAGTSSGIFYKTNTMTSWSPSSGTENVSIDFFYNPNLVFAISGRNIYSSADGSMYSSAGSSKNIINSIAKFNSANYIATNSGLYTDSGTMYSDSINISLINIFNDLDMSGRVIINDISSSNEILSMAMADGRVCIYDGYDYHFINSYTMQSIHKVLTIGESVIAFSFDCFFIIKELFDDDDESLGYRLVLDRPILLSTGMPLL